ncbi:NAD-dependent epimerase/dehydratase family protein [Roseomonas haemaphysalidis]|uniref:NAD-dependent epimerase/dehydratase family protein n=1 Tax=Roseomonas haemaphysalidis TaxID=2768162 RepID=A0ABS3KVC4_9PROT|nr:NAD-dependent epimerase/dehydratase family protein [Roseomonas haemaphysalidis]MBO1081434.1 NAD-dependent epimerase/dehydratase family protein [Roseomonas haemaphysalidis]
MNAAHWRGKRVLVTGGAGFLGSGLCHALGAMGAEVLALDAMLDGSGAHPGNLDGSGATLVTADLRDADLAPHTRDMDAVFNMAGQTSHAGSMADPFADLDINATAQLRLIAALRDGSPDAVLVHASTRQFYGTPRYLPVDEAHPLAPPDPNGVSKLAGEQYWMLEHRTRNRRVTSLRLTNCFGPRLRVRDARQTFLGIWLRRLLEGQPFEVWGGAQLRDLAYLDDVVEAFLLAAETPSCAGSVFNLGGAPPVSLLALAEAAVAANGGGRFLFKEFPAERAAIDIGSYHADDTAFRAATGWAPKVSLEDGLRRSLDWFRPRLEAYL